MLVGVASAIITPDEAPMSAHTNVSAKLVSILPRFLILFIIIYSNIRINKLVVAFGSAHAASLPDAAT
jgi:hypothetical protein